MSEIIKRFIGKDCIITTMNATIVAKIEAVEDNWIIVSSDKKGSGGTDVVNIEYISRITERPKNKNGKNKVFVG